MLGIAIGLISGGCAPTWGAHLQAREPACGTWGTASGAKPWAWQGPHPAAQRLAMPIDANEADVPVQLILLQRTCLFIACNN